MDGGVGGGGGGNTFKKCLKEEDTIIKGRGFYKDKQTTTINKGSIKTE